MNLLGGFTDKPSQSTRIILDDGSVAIINLTYVDNQVGWFYSISWGSGFLSRGRRLTTSANVLRQFKDIIPFGLGVYTLADAEPTAITDLSDGTTEIYLLNSDDVAELEASIFARP